MHEELERWQLIESMVDGPAGREVDDGTLERRLAEFLARSPGDSPIDRSLGSRLGGLVSEAAAGDTTGCVATGARVGAYRVGAVLGEGGMGTVFEAHRVDGSFEQTVALKVLHRSPADAQSRRRFLQERQILAGLRHPHIARLLDGGVVQGAPYLVMELIEGLPITDDCRLHGVSRDDRLRLLLQACDAIRYAHRQGVVHRDLKPSNLLVERGALGEARTVVLDFGIARLDSADSDATATGQVFGTPGYMAPEQALGRRAEVGPRSDVYALGVVLYELLADRKPFEGETHEILHALLHEEPAPLGRWLPDVSVDLETLVARCLASSPDDRYPSVRALAEDLERYLAGEPLAARPIGWVERWLRQARRHPRLTALVVGAVLWSLGTLTLMVVGEARNARALRIERNAAVAAQHDAEELLDFMLEDLHAELDRLGRLDLLEDVARKSAEFYAERDGGAVSSEVAARQAKALINAGAVLEVQGDTAAAAAAYRRTLEIFRQLAEGDGDRRWLVGLARSHRHLASALVGRGEVGPALEHARRAAELTQDLVTGGSTDEEDVVLRFRSLALLGWVAREAGLDEATGWLEEARRLAVDRRAAEASRRDYWRHQVAVAESYLGLVAVEDGDPAQGIEHFEAARKTMEALVRLDPANTEWREELQLVGSHLGEAFLALGDAKGAREALDASRREAEWLVEREPGNLSWRRELAVVHSSLGLVERDQGNLDRALDLLRASTANSETMARRYPHDAGKVHDLAWDLLELGRTFRQSGDEPSAVDAFERSVAALLRLRPTESGSAYDLDTEAQALLELGDVGSARPALQRLAALGWEDPGLTTLCAERGLAADGSPLGAVE